jgi:thiamine biosynthesis protein ThiI
MASARKQKKLELFPKTKKTSNPEVSVTKKPKALLLLSGGIDSPVAGLLAQKKFEVEAVHFSQVPFTDDSPEKKSAAACRKLGLGELIVVNAGEEFKEIAEKGGRPFYFVLMKRFMMKISEKIAEQRGAKFLITGESIGQVSSQTMSNLDTINSATKMEILRPLIFMQKQEIVDLSIANGFFETSKGPELCDALATEKPKTKTKIQEVLFEEERCEMKELVEKALEKIRIVEIK